ncbi:NAD(P)H-dependent oxidoreductase [Bacillus swezeyi]|uniref:NAD(P)H-dependent oxidoreductase n=1 Tax=Bacillus swezeyi TaxID=1925020 RepID=UPI0012393748|nr:NAD(P)H-dependent oxidoreductase [Bacillus swezeyi]KAA6474470.1 flavodoxin family protein [Bacillus swezeyi]
MKNILIINGHEAYPHARGRLNHTIFSAMADKLDEKYNIKKTVVADGYEIPEEHEKFKWADAVIYQTAIYWFSLPALFKKYIDEIYEYGLFYQGAADYGRGGLFTDKKYMFSTTWNAPQDVFSKEGTFFEGKSLDETLFHLHKMQEFVGMKPLKTFSVHDVISNPNVDQYIKDLHVHLKEVFSI